jgi:hypothetical protein
MGGRLTRVGPPFVSTGRSQPQFVMCAVVSALKNVAFRASLMPVGVPAEQ